jgi:hypothetical protein
MFRVENSTLQDILAQKESRVALIFQKNNADQGHSHDQSCCRISCAFLNVANIAESLFVAKKKSVEFGGKSSAR